MAAGETPCTRCPSLYTGRVRLYSQSQLDVLNTAHRGPNWMQIRVHVFCQSPQRCSLDPFWQAGENKLSPSVVTPHDLCPCMNLSKRKLGSYSVFSSFCLSVIPDPPHIKRLFFQNGNLYVQWKNPQNFYSRCLSYQVEVNNSQTETNDIFYVSFP